MLIFSVSEHTLVKLGNSMPEDLGLYDCLQLGGNSELLDITVNGQCCVIELTAL
ncbi:hypothetical protein D3C80_2218000 [compost metagenome]